jgi:hypothetical protein
LQRQSQRREGHLDRRIGDAAHFAVFLDEARGRLADWIGRRFRNRSGDLGGGLDVLDRLGGLDALAALLDRHLGRRRFGDMNRAAYGERTAGRNRGQFR